MSPFSADCPGFDALYTAISGDPPIVTCDAFRADLWVPPDVLGETYTCAADWYTGWTDEDGDALGPADEPTIIDGYEIPALTLTGETTGPGVCQAAVPPDPPEPPTPSNPDDPSIPGGTGSGTNPAGTNATGSTPTLPATGATAPALLLGTAALLLLGGATALHMSRRTAHGRPETV